MNHLLFNDDGYTHEACITAEPGIHDALTFTYRPMTQEECDLVSQAIARQTSGASATRLLAQTIAVHVTSWSMPREISTDEIKQLVPSLFDKLYATIAGKRPSDPLPDTGQVPEAYREGVDLTNLIEGVALLLLHPGPASIDCDQCAAWIYDLETGQRQTVRTGPDRREVPQPRPAGVPTPCASCPKQNPTNARRLKLSTKNRQTYELWRRAKATHFHCVPNHLKRDPIVARNFAHLDDVAKQVQRLQRSTAGEPS
ncbi:hypothetical protein Pan97_24650 [Bremerella volcania]|uniref:Uncharacterized protein n=1 Tax=Bremerella volcania TaxID=2527984 RepID=A0A518C877_9BACT|nr:hypothetical protein [Bremerella volcania]QDU75433.1 hypothetical protein Pan97_24650 [Bremerella volcania]